MNEIERAIDHFEDFLKNMRCHETLLVPEAIPSHELALKLLRAELTRQENAPLTWNERINQMTVEEKAEWVKEYLFDSACEGVCMYNGCNGACTENIIAFFNSPYTEGEKENG